MWRDPVRTDCERHDIVALRGCQVRDESNMKPSLFLSSSHAWPWEGPASATRAKQGGFVTGVDVGLSRRRRGSMALAAVVVLSMCPGAGATPSLLRVAACGDAATEHPPYVLGDPAGKGFEIELWQSVYKGMVSRAAQEGDSKVIRIVGTTAPAMIMMSKSSIYAALKDGTVDIGMCALQTGEDKNVVFTPPHIISGFRAVIRTSTGEVDFVKVLIDGVFRPFTNVYAQAALLLIFYFAIIVAHVFWMLERYDNSAQFNQAYGPGIIDALWYSMVTALTVGYGDKCATNIASKLVAIVWMILSAFFVGIFAAALTSSFLTTNFDSLGSIQIKTTADLALYRVGVISDAGLQSIERYAKGTKVTRYGNDVAMLRALVAGDIQVAVQDARTAQYMANKVSEFSGVIHPTGSIFSENAVAIGVTHNGTYHVVYKLFTDSVYDFTAGSGKAAFDDLMHSWLGTSEFGEAVVGSVAMETALGKSNRLAALVLTGVAVVWAVAVVIHMRDEIREERIRNKLRITLGLGKRFNMLQLRKGAERLFDKYDSDGSGSLDITEIVLVLKSLGKDVNLDDVCHYIDREMENRDPEFQPSKPQPNRAAVHPTPAPNGQVAVTVRATKSNESDDADALLASLEETPRYDLPLGGEAELPEPLQKRPSVGVAEPPGGGIQGPGDDPPTPSRHSIFISMNMASVAPLSALMSDPMKRYANTTVSKDEFVRIVEGLILDEEDDQDQGEINPHGPTHQKHLMQLGGEIQKQMDEVQFKLNGRVDNVTQEINVIHAKLDLVLESLAVSRDKISAALVAAEHAITPGMSSPLYDIRHGLVHRTPSLLRAPSGRFAGHRRTTSPEQR